MNLSPFRLRLLVVALFAVSFLGALDHTVVSTSLATIAGELHALASMSWVFVGYTLASTVVLPVFAKLADLLGTRRVFLASLALFLLASLVCGFAQDIVQLVLARVVQGIGSAGVQLLSQTIVGAAVGARQRPQYQGIIGAAFPVAILVGPVAGGIVTDTLGWRWVFWLNLPVGVLALVLAAVSIPRVARGERHRFDLAGTALLTIATTALVLACSWAGDAGVLAPETLAAGAVALVAGVAFALVERRAPEPVVPVVELRHPTVLISTMLSLVVGAGLFSVVSYVPTYVQMVYGTSATEAGLIPIATVFGMLISSLLTGWLVSRSGRYRAFPRLGTAVGAAGLVVMAFLPLGLPLWAPMAVMGAVGLGTGAFMNLTVAIAQSAAPVSALGRVTAAVNMIRSVGSTVVTAIIGTALGAGVIAALPHGFDASSLTPEAVRAAGPDVALEVARVYAGVFRPIFVGLAAVHAAGLLAALLLPRHRLPERTGSVETFEEVFDPVAQGRAAGRTGTDAATSMRSTGATPGAR